MNSSKNNNFIEDIKKSINDEKWKKVMQKKNLQIEEKNITQSRFLPTGNPKVKH